MAKFTTLVLAALAAFSGVKGYQKPCRAPYDYCGWQLLGGEFGTE